MLKKRTEDDQRRQQQGRESPRNTISTGTTKAKKTTLTFKKMNYEWN
jgi:hypothetical protein